MGCPPKWRFQPSRAIPEMRNNQRIFRLFCRASFPCVPRHPAPSVVMTVVTGWFGGTEAGAERAVTSIPRV